MTTKDGLNFHYDEAKDVMTIEGMKYAGLVFRELGYGLEVGSEFRLKSREEGVIVLVKL